MKRSRFFLVFLFLSVSTLFSACSQASEVSSPPVSVTETASEPTTPAETGPVTETPIPQLNLQVTENYQKDLQGHLYFLSTLDSGLQGLGSLDLTTGEISTLFVSPPKSWLLSLSLDPNSSGILVSYAPPPEEGKPSYGYTDLYILKPDNKLDPVLLRSEDLQAFFGSFFNPAGDTIYYSYFFADSTATSGFRYHINRLKFPGGTPETVVENAFWQRLSPDGTKLAYVTFDGREFDEVFVADQDGSVPVRVLDPVEFPTVDAPFFSPDNQYLYFSAISDQTTPLTWWEKLMGVRLASAHSVPSDFWRVSLVDGSVQQITNLQDQGMFGTFSPDGNTIAFVSATGLYVMRPDGSGLVQVIDSFTLYGSLEWRNNQ